LLSAKVSTMAEEPFEMLARAVTKRCVVLMVIE
jgi:hypothetical protein